MKIGTTRVNEPIGHATAVAVIRDDNLRRLSLNQTADLAGGGLLRLIGGVINEWQISASSSRGVQRPMRDRTLVAGFWITIASHMSNLLH